MENFLRKNVVENHFLIAIAVVAFAWLVFQLQSLIISLFIAYILMAAISPFVNTLEKRRVPRVLACALSYLFLSLLVVLIILPPVPFLFHQFQLLLENFPSYVERVGRILGIVPDSSSIVRFLQTEADFLSRNTLTFTSKIFGGIFGVVTTIVISFYLTLDRPRLLAGIEHIFGKKTDTATSKILAVDQKLGAWLRGQIVLSVAVGMVVWLGLTILGIPFALPLAIIAGLLEIVPIAGPFIAAVPAVVVALTVAPETAFLTIGLYIIVQLLENNLLVPKIMEQAVGLSPLTVMIALIVGAQLMGITGALLAIPVTLVVIEMTKN